MLHPKERMPSRRIGMEAITVVLLSFPFADSWLHRSGRSRSSRHRCILPPLRSTPFEADLYNPYNQGDKRVSPLAVPHDTKLVVGLNKYSHDTTICAADAATGEVLFAMAKERISRRKHDAGNVASLVEKCLECLDLQLENIEKVVMNNHHHRIRPTEANPRHMEWEMGLHINGGLEEGYNEPENLLSHADCHELSHHLAHAYSTAAQAPFGKGLCVVMDGMGETYRTMLQAAKSKDPHYTSDLSFGIDSFECIPIDVAEQAANSPFDFREAESVYVFQKTETSIDIRPIFKRFTPENSSPTLYNHGFENMDSVGAVYSRASSHIFSDWNACGKVMGLAPWSVHQWTDENGYLFGALKHEQPILLGSLYSKENGLKIDRSLMEGIPHCARNDPDMFDPQDGSRKKRYDFDDDDFVNGKAAGKRLPIKVALEAIALADRMQMDLEAVAIDLVKHFQQKTGEKNLCLAGGVALNSVLNGRLARELGFEQTFISPYPGDDGIAVGCCAFGLFGNPRLEYGVAKKAPMWSSPFPPYLGAVPCESDIKAAIDLASPWLDVELIGNENLRLKMMVEEVESGGIIAWYRSRSELGPRALGHRSILADPRKKGLVRFINEYVKSRESFRPFAPSVLAEEATKWFDLGENVPDDANVSPFMSMTAICHKDKRSLIPAVTHVDGSSRLQTVTKQAEPLFHKFISKFFKLTGVPMVLNTSFNTLPSEPIVETPSDAIRSFLYSMGSIEMLVLDDYVIKRKKPDLQKLLGEVSKDGDIKTEPARPKRAGAASFQSSFELQEGKTDQDAVQPVTKVRMPDRPMHGNKNEWFELVDELEGELLSICDGTITLNEIMAQYTAVESDSSLQQQDIQEAQILLQNIVQRLVRLYEHTLISW